MCTLQVVKIQYPPRLLDLSEGKQCCELWLDYKSIPPTFVMQIFVVCLASLAQMAELTVNKLTRRFRFDSPLRFGSISAFKCLSLADAPRFEQDGVG